MIVVKVELHSARTGKVTELARMHISNNGRKTAIDPDLGDYRVETLRKGSEAVQRSAMVINWPRNSKHVWLLVKKALELVYP
jgi:hypothetical protein